MNSCVMKGYRSRLQAGLVFGCITQAVCGAQCPQECCTPTHLHHALQPHRSLSKHCVLHPCTLLSSRLLCRGHGRAGCRAAAVRAGIGEVLPHRLQNRSTPTGPVDLDALRRGSRQTAHQEAAPRLKQPTNAARRGPQTRASCSNQCEAIFGQTIHATRCPFSTNTIPR